MRKLLKCFLTLFLILGFTYAQSPIPLVPVEQPAMILKDFNSFLNYMGGNLKLSEDFVAYDTKSALITKQYFLQLLTTGNYLPLQLKGSDNKLYFKLYKFNSSIGGTFRGSTQGWAQVFYDHYQKVGKKFPQFSFVDLNGNKFNAKTTRGKTIVLKCWFIGCKPCQEEMPALNELVKQYKNRKDVVFISLAPDSKKQLNDFLKRKAFDYAIIPNQKAFMEIRLNVTGYPTHFIINKNGIIVNVVDTPEEIAYTLKNKI